MFPITEWHLCRFAVYYSKFVTSADTVANAITSLRTVNCLAGFPELQNTRLLGWLLKGLRKQMRRKVKQAEPMTPAVLKAIRQVINDNDLTDVVTYALCLVGFYLFLRSSNLVPKSRRKFDPLKQLTRSDFRISGELVVVDIKWSKTAQFGNRLLQLPLLPVADQDICPVTWVKRVWQLIPAGPQDPAFCVPVQGVNLSISYSQLNNRLKKWTRHLGLRSEKFTSHCLRRGGCSFAMDADIPESAIQIFGCWASMSYQRYIDWSLRSRYDTMRKLVQHVNKQSSFSSL